MKKDHLQITEPNLTIEEYIESFVYDDAIQMRLRYAFQHHNDLFVWIKSVSKSDMDIPPIKIQQCQDLNASIRPFVLFITTGLIEHCMNIGHCNVERVLDFNVPQGIFDYNQVSLVAIRWILAHEFYHLIRMHDETQAIVGDDLYAKQALEMDADMMAVSAIYRLFQDVWGNSLGNDVNLRKMVMYSIFWGIRALPPGDTDREHPPIVYRLWVVAVKLSNLRIDREAPADPAWQSEEVRRSFIAVRECLYRCEEEYQKGCPAPVSQDLRADWDKMNDGTTVDAVFARWNEIAPTVYSLIVPRLE